MVMQRIRRRVCANNVPRLSGVENSPRRERLRRALAEVRHHGFGNASRTRRRLIQSGVQSAQGGERGRRLPSPQLWLLFFGL